VVDEVGGSSYPPLTVKREGKRELTERRGNEGREKERHFAMSEK